MANRLKLVDETGRVYDRTGVDIKITIQDDGQTIVVLVSPSPDAERQRKKHDKNFADSLVDWFIKQLERP
jgi:hypothetical protein